MFLVTFHSGNVRAYSDDGCEKSKAVLSPEPQDAELRALRLFLDGSLWVANGSKAQSAILGYTGSGSSYSGGATIVEYPAAEALWHPFDFTFSPDGSLCYVSNQDTNVVARFVVGPGGKSMTPADVAPALHGTFLHGTFVASSCKNLCKVRPTTAVDEQHGGLGVTCDAKPPDCCKPTHSVRGVLWTNGALYVADEPGNAVRVYGDDGTYLGAGTVPAPVHLLEAFGHLYATGSGGIFISNLVPGSPASLSFPPAPSIELENASGMTIGPNNWLYAATRKPTGAQIVVFPHPEAVGAEPKPFPVHADPEFVLYVPG